MSGAGKKSGGSGGDKRTGSEKQPAEIAIKGLEVFAHHGLLDEERESGQLFRFDLDLFLDDCAACINDDIKDTVDYAAVADCVAAAATSSTYFLLERLAGAVAGSLLESFAALSRVRVRVVKVTPPVSHVISSIGVTLERTRR